MTAATTAMAFIALAGIGALSRAALAQRLNRDLPVGTLAANVVASFALGVLDGRGGVAVSIGLLGALSTWSTVAGEVVVMAHSDRRRLALGYLGLSLVGGIGAAWLGLRLR